MDILKQALAALTYIDQRKKKALVAELLPAIESTHKMGFRLTAIHAEIALVIPMPYSTFASCLHRIRRAQKTAREIDRQSPAISPTSTDLIHSDDSDETPASELTLSLEERKQQSRKKLEIFKSRRR